MGSLGGRNDDDNNKIDKNEKETIASTKSNQEIEKRRAVIQSMHMIGNVSETRIDTCRLLCQTK